MIAYLKVKNSEQERIRQRNLKVQRELEKGKYRFLTFTISWNPARALISERKITEEENAAKERQLRKRQKLLEKQERRAAYEAMEKKKLMADQKKPQGWILWTFPVISNFSVLWLKKCKLGDSKFYNIMILRDTSYRSRQTPVTS